MQILECSNKRFTSTSGLLKKHVDPGPGNCTPIVSIFKPLQEQVVTGTGKLTYSAAIYIFNLLPYGAKDQCGRPEIWQKSG